LVDIAILRTNSVIYDARAIKILKSLNKRYSLLVLGWNREGNNNQDIEEFKSAYYSNFNDRCKIKIKILKVRAPFGKQSLFQYVPMIIYFPIFWIWVFINLCIYRTKIVHACDLDTVLPGYIYKLIYRKKLVFDVFDRYAMTFIPVRFKRLYGAVNRIEEFFARKTDLLIAVGENILSTFKTRPKRTSIITNCSEDYNINAEKTEDHILRLVYTGPLAKGRGLENTALAIEDLENVEFYIYGPLIDNNLLSRIRQTRNVMYGGFLSNEDYYRTIVAADVMVALYGPEGPLQQTAYNITVHNKTFEAMMCGVPIITNVSTDLVKEINFGILVEYEDVAKIRNAVTSLRDDPEFRRSLGTNGRKAFLMKYNWQNVEKELYRVYSDLLSHERVLSM
jgi:glycosyltransferase involved in cell wall biosynthesis